MRYTVMMIFLKYTPYILVFIFTISTSALLIPHSTDAAMLRPVSDTVDTEGESEEIEDEDRDEGDLSSSSRKALRELAKREPIESHAVPVFGVFPLNVTDTWGDARSNDRTHEGTDIFATRNTILFSPFDGVVRRIDTGENGGLHVYITGPGSENYYFAHLESVNPKLDEGDVIKAGHFIGRVGDSGNAVGTSPHLHLGIYTREGAINPFPRLKRFINGTEIRNLVNSIIS